MAFITRSSHLELLLNTYLLGVCQALVISVPREPVTGFVSNSVLLPVSYWIPEPPPVLHITWIHQNSIILFSEMVQCPSEPTARLTMCHNYDTVRGEYTKRATFYPGNGSLSLSDLRVGDSGRYTVTFKELNQTRHLTLVVLALQTDPGIPDPALDSGKDEEELNAQPSFLQPLGVRFGCLAIFLLVILGLHFQRWRKVY